MTALLVVLGAALGAPTRYVVDGWLRSRHPGPCPWGTLAVNAAGSLLLGLLVGLDATGRLPATALSAAGTGFCGALTTYRTFDCETEYLRRDRQHTVDVAYVTGSVLLCCAAAAMGWQIGALT